MRRMRTEILLYDGFDELDGLGPFEVLRTAGLEAELVSIDGPADITGSHGAVIRTARALGDPDLVIVPGGGWNTRSGAGAWGEAQRGTIPAALADAARRRRPDRLGLHRRHAARHGRHPARPARRDPPQRARRPGGVRRAR